MILSYVELVELAKSGVICGVRPQAINAASIDVHLGQDFMRERAVGINDPVDLAARESIGYNKVSVGWDGDFLLYPSEFVLAHTIETFNLPDNISAHFMLKSSIARNGINQMAAVWCDAGWSGSSLTLELKNDTRYHTLRMCPGMAIGQMVFHRHTTVPVEQSYRVRGRYNYDKSCHPIKL